MRRKLFGLDAKKSVFLAVATIFLLANAFTALAQVYVEKEEYIFGEQVGFTVEADESGSVEIYHDGKAFRLIGNPVGEHKFYPESTGAYSIRVLDSHRSIVYESDFRVVDKQPLQQNNVIYASKNNYLPGEEVKILIDESTKIVSVRITTGENTYSLLGEPEFPLSFYPDKQGEYDVVAIDSLGQFYSTSFTVAGPGTSISAVSTASTQEILGETPVAIRGANGLLRSAEIRFYKTIPPGNITTMDVQPSSSEEVVKGNVYDVEIRPLGSAVREINVKGFVFSEEAKIGLEDMPVSRSLGFNRSDKVKAYALELGFEFEEAVFTSTAMGTELYVCEDWDFELINCGGEWSKKMDLVPGTEYEVLVSSRSSAYAETGVASVNTNKSIYQPGEEAGITMVVLDTYGYLVSGADVVLEVTSPDGNTSIFSTVNNTIVEEKTGIYTAVYEETIIEGYYQLFVNASAINVDSSMFSHFLVLEVYEFDILRETPMTIDPRREEMVSTIRIISYVDTPSFEYTEVLPVNFTIIDAGGATVEGVGDTTLLTWSGLQNNSEITYTAAVPEIIPYLWSIGPSNINYDGQVFTEARPWYLAVDPITYYDLTSTIQEQWSRGSGITHAEISKGVRQPSEPSVTTYVASRGNDGHVSEFGFPSIAEEEVDEITLWVYTSTGGNVEYTFSLRQGTTTVCSTLVPPGTSIGWQSCTWSNPTGDLSDMRVFLSEVNRNGGGQLTDALVYAAYIEVDTGIPPPTVELVSPADNAVTGNSNVNFTFKAIDDYHSTIDECTLYADFTGTWASVGSVSNVLNNTNTGITQSLSDGVYIWNVLCDNGEGSAFAPSNYTVTVNAVPPLIENAALNESVIRQNRSVYFNATITDSFGISHAFITLKHPDDSEHNITLDNDGDEYFTVITDTSIEGMYELMLIWANDTFGQVGFNDSTGLSFEVQAIPPEPFNLLSPPNATESRDLTPTLEWEEASTPDFANYTILIDKDPEFGSPEFTYHTFSVGDTSFELPVALDANDVYYWKVIAYDVFSNSRNSTDTFMYINDRIPPTVTLNSPAHNDFTTLSTVEFSYTPNDANTIASCTLYGNWSGSWQPTQTNFSINKGQPNFFYQEVVEGHNSWNVQCNDSATNAAFATQNRTIILDQTSPVVTLNNPANNSLIDDTNIINFYAVAYDELAQVDSCSLYVNETLRDTKTGITDNVEFNFTLFLTNDYYSWRVQCNDTNGNTDSSGTFFLTVESLDTDPPVITLNWPVPNEYLQSGSVTFNYSVEDASGIENCSLVLNGDVYDTDYSVDNFANNFFFATGLAEQLHNWSVACYDNSSEFNFGVSSTRFFTVDLTDPVVSLESPGDGSLLNYSNVAFEYIPVDDNLASCALYSDFSGVFEQVAFNNSPASGAPNFFYYAVPDGVFEWNVLCTDLSGRNSFAPANFSLRVDTIPPQYFNVSEDPVSPATYAPSQDYYFSVEWTDNFQVDEILFEHNFSGVFVNETPVFEGGDVYSFTASDLPAGSYSYRWYANDTATNMNKTSLLTYNVVRASSEIELLLNGSANNVTINENDEVGIQASLVTPSSGYLELLLNGALINNGTAPLQNNTIFPLPGEYNVTAVYNETQNYTASSRTLFITVEDVTPPLVTLKTPANSSSVGDGEVTFVYNVSDNSPIQSCSLYINGSLEETNTNIQRNTDQFFFVDMGVGNYYWNVSCTDEASNTGGSSPHFFEVVDVDELVVSITFGENEYEVGDTALITTTVTDIFNNPLTADVHTTIISSDTSVPWWDSEWNKRRPIIMDETSGIDIINGVAEVNISGLEGLISDCDSGIRLVSHATLSASEIPFTVYSGDGSDWCRVAFPANLSASASNNMDYYVYYDNPSAVNPGYGFSTVQSVWLNANAAAGDEGTPTGVANIIGKNDDTFATMTQGGGTGTHSAHGAQFIDVIPGSEVIGVQVRYRYQVPTVVASTLWELRYSLNGTSPYSALLSGSASVIKTTSPWFNITSAYPSLSWQAVNDTRLQARISKSGGGTTTMYLFWVEMNVTYRPFPNITSTSVGGEEVFIAENSGTASGGSLDWYWSSQGVDVGDYSVVSVASREDYTTSSSMSVLNIVPDETPPNVILISPPDGEERGKGLVNFTYEVFDINLDACTLYIGLYNESLVPNVSDLSPVNNESNTFEDVFVDIGLWEWNVQCNDTEGNDAFAPENFLLNISAPDLVVRSDDIWFSESQRVEGVNVTVFANISNEGLSDAEDDFAVQFFLGDPDNGGVQVGSDVIVEGLESFETVTVSVLHTLQAGVNTIFVLVDPYNDVNESDTANNKANNSVVVELYQYFYGVVSTDLLLGDSGGSAFVDYLNRTGFKGHILVADVDSVFDFADLQALTRNIDGNLVSGVFSELDAALGTVDFPDSIRNTWGGGSDSPLQTRTFNLTTGPIHNVPVFNSTNDNTDFVTGILWDTSDDSGNERFDSLDSEDVVFIVEINPSSQGKYGVYDYEIRVPAVLRDYAGSNDKLSFYVEII